MADPQFEIAFSGQIAEGADLATVKQNISKLFNADAERLEQMKPRWRSIGVRFRKPARFAKSENWVQSLKPAAKQRRQLDLLVLPRQVRRLQARPRTT